MAPIDTVEEIKRRAHTFTIATFNNPGPQEHLIILNAMTMGAQIVHEQELRRLKELAQTIQK